MDMDKKFVAIMFNIDPVQVHSIYFINMGPSHIYTGYKFVQI